MTAKVLFIAATDTNAGKTYVAVELIRELRKIGIRVGAYKPVASGGALDDLRGDPYRLAEAVGIDVGMLDKVCPQSFMAPLAAPVSARLEGRAVNESQLREGMTWWLDRCDWLIVESAGGLMSPITENKTVIDLAQDINSPILLVVPNKLGCISHSLLAVEAMRRRNLNCCGILLNDVPEMQADQDANAAKHSNFGLLSQFLSSERLYRSVTEVVQALHE